MEELRKSLRERDRLIENINAVAVQHEDDAKVMAIIAAKVQRAIIRASEVHQYYGLVRLCFQPSTTLVRGTLAIHRF